MKTIGWFRSSNFLLFGLMICVACKSSNEKLAALDREVLEVHDRLMPKMDEMMRLKVDINKTLVTLDSLETRGVSGTNVAQEKVKAHALEANLMISDSLMMKWMNEYKGDSVKHLTNSIAEDYFAKEKAKIERIEAQTLKAIDDAKVYLN